MIVLVLSAVLIASTYLIFCAFNTTAPNVTVYQILILYLIRNYNVLVIYIPLQVHDTRALADILV